MCDTSKKKPQIWLRIIPQISLVALLAAHLSIGAIVFKLLDAKLAELTFLEVVFFEFITISTIGYGNVAPTTDAAKLFTILFSIIGTPLLIVTLANFGKYLTKGFWKILLLTCCRVTAKSKLAKDRNMPLSVIILFYIFTILFGMNLIKHNGESRSIDDVYFGFISFATVGFGDRVPLTPDSSSLLQVLFYLSWGVMLTTILFNVCNDYLSNVNYFGRRFKGTRDVEVWMNGQCFTVSQITSLVAQQFHASPHQVRTILQELDDLIENAVKQNTDDNIILSREQL